jgi:hypothetical protein
MAKIGRNDPCPCGIGKKFKKCCAGKMVVKGVFDPDLPISKGGDIGNHRGSDGAWYVIRKGHAHGPITKLNGERLERARHMIGICNMERLDADIAKARRRGAGTLTAGLLAVAALAP